MSETIISFLFLLLIFQSQPLDTGKSEPIAQREFSLQKRYEDAYVNTVFKDNILLTLRYAAGQNIDPKKVDWQKIQKPFRVRLVLKPKETFAFHDDVLPKYVGKVSKTTNAHFNAREGFKSSGFLVGDGVCHLASLLYWVAKDADLEVIAPTKHNFAPIPEVPKEFCVSIYAYPGSQTADQAQNLYITNNKDSNIAFEFFFNGETLKITATKTL